jgi:hypothetical protein
MQIREMGIYTLKEFGGQWMDASGWLALWDAQAQEVCTNGTHCMGKLHLIWE